ncbi:MAG: NAD(P)H-dependent oxidoreductase [Chthoniobacterales bacterium]
MKTVDGETVLGALNWRYATKSFDADRKIDAETWETLEQSLVLAPSSFGLQPWKFLVVEDAAKREELVAKSWGQRQVAEASHLVVVAVKSPVTAEDVRRHVARTAEVQGIEIETLAGFEKVVNGFLAAPPYPLDLREWASRQAYIALGQFMVAAAMLGVDTCPMEGLDPAGYDAVLGLEGSGYFTVVACPTGYRSGEDRSAGRAKVRFAREDVLVRI